MDAVERCSRGCREAATAKAVAEKCHEKKTRTGHDAAIEALLSQGRATDAGGTSGCASDERAHWLIGWAETPKDGMINRHRGV